MVSGTHMADTAVVDPLAKLNDELRGRGDAADDSPWLPLESNPVCVVC